MDFCDSHSTGAIMSFCTDNAREQKNPLAQNCKFLLNKIKEAGDEDKFKKSKCAETLCFN